MKIACGVSFYECKEELKRCLDSIQKADIVYAIDGRYMSYMDKNEDGLSADGSRKLCKEYSNVTLIDRPKLWQIEKRNTYLREAGKDGCDILLVVDSDVWIEGDWEAFRLHCGEVCNEDNGYRYLMPHKNGKNGAFMNQIYGRILYKPEVLHYAKTHGSIWIGNRQIFPKKGNPVIRGLVSYTDLTLRSEERERMAQIYKDANHSAEARGLIKEHNQLGKTVIIH